jgi:hypothetical protein
MKSITSMVMHGLDEPVQAIWLLLVRCVNDEFVCEFKSIKS